MADLLPWRFVVMVAQIPEIGLHQDFQADASQRTALAEAGGLVGVSDARASVELTHAANGRVHAVGRVTANVEQTCVVTLELVHNVIDEPIDVMFAPAEQIPKKTPVPEEGVEIPDPPEPIVGGAIDLGKLASDFLFLGIDPYPRKPGVVFNVATEESAPDEHPFAALKALKTRSEPPKTS